MRDEADVQALEGAPASVSAEIGSSLCSVWARYVGARPSESETQVESGVVRWVLPNGTSEFEEAMSADRDAEAPDKPRRTMAGYKRETSAVVARITRSRVAAMISKHDAKTGIATEVFVLDRGPRKY
jgi:uncharacterized protein YbcI